MALNGKHKIVNKASDNRNYLNVGRLKYNIANKAGVIAANIKIDKNTITHIINKHQVQLEQLGVSPIMFVRMVISTFNQIYEGHDNRILLVCNEGKTWHNSITIGLKLVREKKGCFWSVVTACPHWDSYFKHKKCLYDEEKAKKQKKK